MQSEYEFSLALLFWGDSLDSQLLQRDIQLIAVRQKAKGDAMTHMDGTPSGSAAKTGLLSFTFDADLNLKRDPYVQLQLAFDALKKLVGSLADDYGVASAELQVNIYYQNQIKGEPDFLFPTELVDLLALHRIGLRITALP